MGKAKSESVKGVYIDPRAVVASSAKIGTGTKVWAFAQVGENAQIGKNCVIGNGAYIDRNARIGNNVKVHNKALIYRGVIIGDNCFIGPGVCFTNDKTPTYNKRRNLKGKRWYVRKGAIIGANATILPDINIGEGAVVGAGSVVTKSVTKKRLVCGNPAKVVK